MAQIFRQIQARQVALALLMAVAGFVAIGLSAPAAIAQEAKKPAAAKPQDMNEALARIDRLEAQILEMQSVIGALQTLVQKNGIRQQPLRQQPAREFQDRPVDTPKFQTDGWGIDTEAQPDSLLQKEEPVKEARGADLSFEGTPPRSEVKLNGQSPRALYDAGYNYMMASDYKSAEATFKAFLDSYPQDQLSGNAQYWLGEVYFVRGDYRRAANEFLKGYKNHRNSPKAPDNLLKLGMALRNLGQGEAACQTYSELRSKYKSLPGHISRKLNDEVKRTGC